MAIPSCRIPLYPHYFATDMPLHLKLLCHLQLLCQRRHMALPQFFGHRQGVEVVGDLKTRKNRVKQMETSIDFPWIYLEDQLVAFLDHFPANHGCSDESLVSLRATDCMELYLLVYVTLCWNRPSKHLILMVFPDANLQEMLTVEIILEIYLVHPCPPKNTN